MDFKKAYEDALERAKGIYNENPSSSTAKFVCGQIFPEIKESEDERIRKDIIVYLSNELYNVEQLTPRTNEFEAWIAYLERQKEQQPKELSDVQPAKSNLAEGVYYIKDGQPVAEYEDGVDTDRLLIIGKYCRFYISMADLGMERFAEAQKKAESLGEGWRCPDSFEGRTIGKMSDEIREKAAKIGAEHFKDKGWFWTNEVFDRWNACSVSFTSGGVYGSSMSSANNVLALSAFQN